MLDPQSTAVSCPDTSTCSLHLLPCTCSCSRSIDSSISWLFYCRYLDIPTPPHSLMGCLLCCFRPNVDDDEGRLESEFSDSKLDVFDNFTMYVLDSLIADHLDSKDDHLPKSPADGSSVPQPLSPDGSHDNLHASIEKFCEIFKDVTPTVNEEAVHTYNDTEDVRSKPTNLKQRSAIYSRTLRTGDLPSSLVRTARISLTSTPPRTLSRRPP